MKIRLLALLACALLVGACVQRTGTNSGNADEPAKEPTEQTSPEQPEEVVDDDDFCPPPPAPRERDLGGVIKVGDKAPNFTLLDINTSQPVSLESFRGKMVLLWFWASWCPNCRVSVAPSASMQVMHDYIQTHAPDTVAIVGIGTGADDTPQRQHAFIASNECEWVCLHDTDSAVEAKYGVLGVPTVVVVDADGYVLTYGRFTRRWRDELVQYVKDMCVPEGK